jgi:hypothetical protein
MPLVGSGLGLNIFPLLPCTALLSGKFYDSRHSAASTFLSSSCSSMSVMLRQYSTISGIIFTLLVGEVGETINSVNFRSWRSKFAPLRV